MATPKRSSLQVSFSLPVVPSFVREATLIQHPKGYLYVQYSGPRREVSIDFNECKRELLTLYPPSRRLTEEELGVGREEELAINNPLPSNTNPYTLHIEPPANPKRVINFLNKWGQVGLFNEQRSAALSARGPELNLMLEGIRGSRTSSDYVTMGRLKSIYKGDEVPYWWIEESLRTLARMTRFTTFLYNSKSEHGAFLELNIKNVKRILWSWDDLPFTYDDSQDPADSEFATSSNWILTRDGVRILDAEFAENAIAKFAKHSNEFLLPLFRSVVTTENFDQICAREVMFETAYSSHLLNLFKQTARSFRRCEECGHQYMPMRDRGDNKYCTIYCKQKVSNRKHKAKLRQEKISSKEIEVSLSTTKSDKPRQTQKSHNSKMSKKINVRRDKTRGRKSE